MSSQQTRIASESTDGVKGCLGKKDLSRVLGPGTSLTLTSPFNSNDVVVVPRVLMVAQRATLSGTDSTEVCL